MRCSPSLGSSAGSDPGPRRFPAIALLALAMLAPACGKGDGDARKVDLAKREPVAEQGTPSPRVLRTALGGIITPREGMAYYREFLGYLERRLGTTVQAVDKEDYAEINRLLQNGSLDFGFVCSGPYVDGHDSFGLKLLVAPQAHGGTVYHSYIIVPAGSSSRSLDDLRGKHFAFTDPLSNTGCLVPTYLLARRGETPASFFGETSFTRGHDRSIRAVAEELVDGAAVDSLIWEYLSRTDPGTTGRTRIVERSPPYAIPPVVVKPDLDPEVERRLKRAFLEAHENPEGRAILDRMMIDRFVEIDDGAFASVREMKDWLAKQGGAGR